MTQIEKRYDKHGQLEWVKGKAREVYTDNEVRNATARCYRIPRQDLHYDSLLPAHLALDLIDDDPPKQSIDEMIANNGLKLRPFVQWQFVLIAKHGSDGNELKIAREISGKKMIEVDILHTD